MSLEGFIRIEGNKFGWMIGFILVVGMLVEGELVFSNLGVVIVGIENVVILMIIEFYYFIFLILV